MTAAPGTLVNRSGIRRDGATWFVYLLLGYFTYLSTSQGNLVPFLRDELSLGYAAVSLHISAIAAGILIVGLIADRVVARFGRRRILIASALGSATALAGLTLAATPVVSIGSCFFMGLLGAFIPAMTSATLSDIHGARRDIALVEANALCYVFALAAPLLIAFAVETGLSWRIVPLAGTVAALVIVGAFWRTPVPEGIQAVRTAGTPPAPLPPAYWAYWAFLGLGVALEFCGLFWAPSYLQAVIGLSQSSAALGAGTFFVAMLVGRIVSIALFRSTTPRRIFLGMVALIALGFLAYWLAPHPAVAVAGLFVIGLGIAPFFPLGISLVMGTVEPAHSNRAGSRAMLAPALAILLNPPLLGSIADAAGLWLAQVIMPVFLAFAVVAFFTGQRLATRLPQAASSSS